MRWLRASKCSTDEAASGRFYNSFIEIPFPPELEAALTRIGAEPGRGADQVAMDFVRTQLGHDLWLRQEIRKGMASLDRGESLSHEEVSQGYGRYFTRDATTVVPEAADDLAKILEFVHLNNPAAAQRVVEKLFDGVVTLKEFPAVGRNRRERGTRELMFSPLPYIVVYRQSAEAVEIIRVLHGAQRWPT